MYMCIACVASSLSLRGWGMLWRERSSHPHPAPISRELACYTGYYVHVSIYRYKMYMYVIIGVETLHGSTNDPKTNPTFIYVGHIVQSG